MGKEQPVEFKLKVPWGHIAAKAWGTKNNIHVLMVHGIMDNIGSFERLLPLLPDKFFYVAIDLPGHGRSSHMTAGTILNFYDYILTIKYVLDELQWKETYYIGHSFGASLGSFFTLVYPGRIKKLVQLDNIVSKYIPDEKILDRIRMMCDVVVQANKTIKNQTIYNKEEIIYALMNLRLCCLKREAAEALFERTVTKVGDDAYVYNRDLRARISLFTLHNYELSRYFLEQLKVETLIILVDNSLPLLIDINTEMCKVFDNSSNVQIVRIKGNHDVHNNYPERVSEHLCKFLNHIPSKL